MKRFLSIFLAVTMILAMMPTTFAAVDETTGAITYEFEVDNIRSTEAVYMENAAGTWLAAYKNYPAEPTDAGANWAYCGTTISTPANDTKGFTVVTGSYIQTGSAKTGEWIALRINVPKSGKYMVSATGYKKKTFSNSADLYIAPITAELEAKLAEGNVTTYGTVANAARTEAASFEYLNIPETAKVGNVSFYKSGSTASEMELITGVEMSISAGENIVLFNAVSATAAGMFPSSLTLTPQAVTAEPTITVSSDKAELLIGEEAILSSVVTDSTGATVTPGVTYTTENTDIVSISGNVVAGAKDGVATITATATVDGKAVTDTIEITINAKKYTYEFDTSATTEDEAVDLLNGGTFTINPQVSSAWGYIGNRRLDYINLGATYLTIRASHSYTELGTNGIVLTITVPEKGTYIPILNYTELANGGKISTYIVDPDTIDPVTGKAWDMSDDGIFNAVANVITDAANVTPVVKTIASAVNTSTAATTDSPYVGGQVGLKNKTYYLVIAMDGTEATLNARNKYFAYIDSIELKKVGELVVEPTIEVSSDKTNILVGETATLSSTITDSKADDVTATTSVAYTTTSDCVSISGNKVTGVKEGTALVTATASVEGKSVTDTIEIVVSVKTYDYIFSVDVLKGDILENASFTQYGRPFYDSDSDTVVDSSWLSDYAYIDTAKTLPWAITTLGGAFNSIEDSDGEKVDSEKSASNLNKSGYIQMVGRKTLQHTDDADARFVLKLSIPVSGTYDITADIIGIVTGAEADIYIVPVSEIRADITSDTLKTLPIIGRVCGVTDKVDGDIGNYNFKTAGDYYMIFSFNSNNITGNSSKQFLNLAGITLKEGEPEEEKEADGYTGNAQNLSFSATANIPEAKISVNGVIGNNKVISAERGDKISVSAPEVEGYEFIGWKRGVYSADANGLVEDSEKFILELSQNGTYAIYSNTFLTAVYEEENPAHSDDPTVEFWNMDGSYLGAIAKSILATKGLPEMKLTGFNFLNWKTENGVLSSVEEIIAPTKAVAQYTELTVSEIITVNGKKVGADGKESSLDNVVAIPYATEIVCNDGANVTHWLRDGKIVSYNKEYTHYVWDATRIYSSYATVVPKPLVVLEDTTIEGGYMIEYEASSGYEIVEVGILFGNRTPSVESCDEKFTSSRGLDHGQFTARPTDSSYIARGYMIYKDTDNSYKVIYSD